MTWQAVALLLVAAVLATAGALLFSTEQPGAAEEAGAQRAIAVFGLLATAVALAAVGGAMLGWHAPPSRQIGAAGAAAATVVLPVLVVALARRGRRAPRRRRWGLDG